MNPIILIGTHRSGTSWLGHILSSHPTLAYWIEPRYVWSWGNNYKPDDILTAADATPIIISHIRQRFKRFVQEQGNARLFEKTPSNCLRLPFIRAVYPEAKILHIIRDGRSVFSSTSGIMRAGFYRQDLLICRMRELLSETPVWEWPASASRIAGILSSKLLRRPIKYWGPRPAGWHEWIDKDSPNVILAKQWAATIQQAISDSNQFDAEHYYRFRYEDLLIHPKEIAREVIEFIELPNAGCIVDQLASSVDISRQYQWNQSLDSLVLEEIRSYMEPVLRDLGYDW
jgi:hypothetical protein